MVCALQTAVCPLTEYGLREKSDERSERAPQPRGEPPGPRRERRRFRRKRVEWEARRLSRSWPPPRRARARRRRHARAAATTASRSKRPPCTWSPPCLVHAEHAQHVVAGEGGHGALVRLALRRPGGGRGGRREPPSGPPPGWARTSGAPRRARATRATRAARSARRREARCRKPGRRHRRSSDSPTGASRTAAELLGEGVRHGVQVVLDAAGTTDARRRAASPSRAETHAAARRLARPRESASDRPPGTFDSARTARAVAPRSPACASARRKPMVSAVGRDVWR